MRPRSCACLQPGMLWDSAFKESIRILEKAYGRAAPVLSKVLINYAACLRKMGREKEAEEMEERAKGMGKARKT